MTVGILKNNTIKILLLIIVLLFTFYFLLSPRLVTAATNISSLTPERWAWNDKIGWIDFYITTTVTVTNTKIEGYASSQVGLIAFDCATTPNGNVCSGPAGDWKITNDGVGNLSGWAWNDNIGWISFNCQNTSSCASTNYKVTISAGEFNGWAWNDAIGWISFNCDNSGIGNTCGVSDYRVKTSWGPPSPVSASLTSSIFDTQVGLGAAINTIMWQGALNGGEVKFQITSSNNLAGPWNFSGPDGSDTTFYQPAGPDAPIKINLAHHNNKRYVRYRIFLKTDSLGINSPRVDDIIINWSR
ncbi:MAG: hypothetical protein A2745_02610 [Candidatus Harrisonbacteria bacterium RIFCSPHIGHO2_01_FULL_44_13]|uniref:Uncharacterized protein n=1 Tax=Candidatus Harrisonbacteria bacterium RIFCSPLOWO2_01_FULL_44_18 TaxID=1798407 RepID=A0A1G1ZPE5_9BACT|nr:MAG: hypothetical protein A2745_02610 [Candidatus Harrisonbacteria bacterium RIFCSPHIGHO2_01_FULL_44_13]OGY66299.1 MAG: hypothetical protein A3A16_00100 [Candidatus Harrisonbacteria bacterium RIFCSPLOWO2_01_FULL_44_18]